MPQKFLIKSDPDTYSLHHLRKDGQTVWDGVRNPVAQKHLRSMKKGDAVLVYHTGDEKSVVGLARAASDPYPDPKDKTGRLHVFDIQYVAQAQTPVSLATVKADPVTRQMELARLPRLSVMPVGEKEWKHLTRLAGLPA